MKYNKLVRDKIPKIIEEKAQTAITHIADDKEYWEKLVLKLREEVAEFAAEPSAEEMADIMEVLYAICDHKNISRDELEALRRKKADERGGFTKRFILTEVKR